jgi:aspartate kinase
MKVLKFGGTSLANRMRVLEVSRLVRAAAAETRVVVVASAMAGVTNRLERLTGTASDRDDNWTEELEALERRHLEVLAALPASSREPAAAVLRSRIRVLRADLEALAGDPLDRPEICDRILSVGERLSVELLAATLQGQGCAARAVDAADLVATDSSFGEARVDFARTAHRCRRLLEGRNTAIPIVTGFIGADRRGRTTTLGRGGSDYSAAVLGAVLGAERVEIWTDVDGVLTAPPLLVPGASSIPRLSYEEAAELSFFGAKVLHPQTVRPLAERGIPIHVRNSLAPARRGTEIGSPVGAAGRVVAVSAVEEAAVFRFGPGGACDLHDALMVCRASSDGATLAVVPAGRAESFARPSCERLVDGSVLTLVGLDIARQPWVAGRALESLARRGISVRSFAAGASPHTVVLLVDRGDLEIAMCTIHDGLMLDRQTVAGSRKELGLGQREVAHVTAA